MTFVTFIDFFGRTHNLFFLFLNIFIFENKEKEKEKEKEKTIISNENPTTTSDEI